MSTFSLPYKGKIKFTSPYGDRILNGEKNWHSGIDLVGLDNKTILAPCNAKVGASTILSKETDKTLTWQWGNYVRLDCDDGLKIYLCHLATRYVKAGDIVKVGDPIGIEGNTGYSFGSHCHFEVRKNNTSINPCPLLGIENKAGVTLNAATATQKKSYPDTYTSNGLTFKRLKSFRIVYHDATKADANYYYYVNAGFFGNFKASSGTIYTLPVANLVCDPWNVPVEGRAQMLKHIKNNKIFWSCADNHSDQFKGKKVSTLIIPEKGDPYVADVAAPPVDCQYAISGVPAVRNGDDVDYYNYVKPQGWDESCMRATFRNWIGVRNGELWLITGNTTTNNYIYGMEFWKKVKNEQFDDILTLDGGGSYIYRNGPSIKKTAENRRVNNLIVFT